MLIISVTLLSFSKTFVFSLKELKLSEIRFITDRVVNNEKNRLLGTNFLSPSLFAGERSKKIDRLSLTVKVENINETLKKIIITAYFGKYHSKKTFYKSQLIGRAIYE